MASVTTVRVPKIRHGAVDSVCEEVKPPHTSRPPVTTGAGTRIAVAHKRATTFARRRSNVFRSRSEGRCLVASVGKIGRGCRQPGGHGRSLLMMPLRIGCSRCFRRSFVIDSGPTSSQ
jgi:hypothetical protein